MILKDNNLRKANRFNPMEVREQFLLKKVFISGSSGFIGRNLVEKLELDYDVYAPDHRELDLLDEFEVRKYLVKHQFDVIIHTATHNATRNSKVDISKVLPSNLRMFNNIARCNADFGKMYYFGSGADYDLRSSQPRMKEDYFDINIPADDYGFSKYIMSMFTQNSTNIFNLRLFGVFGKYEDWEIRFISNACCKAIWDLPITIRQNVYFDYLYIDDLIKIMKWFIENAPKEKCYNVCSGRVYDLKSLANMVLKASDKKLDIIVGKEGLAREYSGDNSRMLAEMGETVIFEMNESIKELYNWYLERKQAIDPKLLIVNK